MIHSLFFKKETNEDPKTSTVFENLILLPDMLFWSVLKQSCFDSGSMPLNCGALIKYEFWPHWNSHGTNNSYYVEPDVFFRFDKFDVIIEAKYGDYGGQNEEQWRKEIIAYHNTYGDSQALIFIAVGGFQAKNKDEIIVDSVKVNIYKCSWQSILDSIEDLRKKLCNTSSTIESAQVRLLDNLLLYYETQKMNAVKWYLPNKYSINENSINNLKQSFLWINQN